MDGQVRAPTDRANSRVSPTCLPHPSAATRAVDPLCLERDRSCFELRKYLVEKLGVEAATADGMLGTDKMDFIE